MELKSLKVLKRISFECNDEYAGYRLMIGFINANKISKEDIWLIKEYRVDGLLYFYEEVQIKRPATISHPDEFISNKF